MLQLAVFPYPLKGVEKKDYPYISYFEPKKRELYQTISENGEILSGSSSKANITKGITSMNTMETSQLDLGGGTGGHSGVFGLWSEQHSDDNKKEGWENTASTQNQNIRTTDTSRENRESYSHSTQLNQLYTQLQSYHLGTNRSIFFLQPRPYYKDSKFTFIKGLRRLEGIQDFFFIINRPNEIPGISLEIALETAHLFNERRYIPRFVSAADFYIPENLSKSPEARPISPNNLRVLFQKELELEKVWNDGHPFIRNMALGFVNQDARYSVSMYQARMDDPGFITEFWKMVELVESNPNISTSGGVKLILEEIEYDTGQMFTTARKLKCNTTTLDNGTEIPGEQSNPGNIDSESSNCFLVSEWPRLTMERAGNNLQDIMYKSVVSDNRYKYGVIDLTTSLFFTSRLKSAFNYAFPKRVAENEKNWNEIEKLRISISRQKDDNRDENIRKKSKDYIENILKAFKEDKPDDCIKRFFLSQQIKDRELKLTPENKKNNK